MTVQVRGKLLKLIDSCPVEDAETVHEKLLEKPELSLDLSQCQHMHSAVLQVLLLQPRPIRRAAEDVFLKQWIQPLLQRALDTVDRREQAGDS